MGHQPKNTASESTNWLAPVSPPCSLISFGSRGLSNAVTDQRLLTRWEAANHAGAGLRWLTRASSGDLLPDDARGGQRQESPCRRSRPGEGADWPAPLPPRWVTGFLRDEAACRQLRWVVNKAAAVIVLLERVERHHRAAAKRGNESKTVRQLAVTLKS